MTKRDRYPHVPGHRGNSDTGIAAAQSMIPFVGTIRNRVLAVVAVAGLTGAIGDEVGDALDLLPHQVRARLSELRRDGKVADSGKRRKGASGRSGIAWVLPEYRRQDAA